MKIGETLYAAVRHDGTIQGSPEGIFIDENEQVVFGELDNWRIPLVDVTIKKIRIVEIED